VLPRWAAPVAVAVVLAVQPLLGDLDAQTQFALTGFVDWIGHLATGVVLVALLRPPRRMAAAILAGSVLIDLDHLPLQLLHTDVLTAGTPRPYTHSLLTALVLLAAAGAARSQVLLGLAIGVAGHLLRDIGTGDGVALLWPLTDDGVVLPFGVYVAVLAVLAFAAAVRPRAWRAARR
jgi:inner membrane protein